ncbi:hypothetical protein J2X63_003159 [Agromyces sp. 3263]|uniref:hypothetical protein n=1 Tax=Agromyces sp. 3263 TaxID=2817750 RepID=UPI0028676144|nr:hypothetical protein [Agromyces sp. 3263]MDR6907451.1 hypothetical protein [Agromyces sp. 3263]
MAKAHSFEQWRVERDGKIHAQGWFLYDGDLASGSSEDDEEFLIPAELRRSMARRDGLFHWDTSGVTLPV